MSKLSFYVHVCGDPFDTPGRSDAKFCGPNTHMRSEATWPLGVALNLARHGHQVKILAYKWGDQSKWPLPPNVTLQKEFKGDCDVFIDMGWEDVSAPARCTNINAKMYLHGWGGGLQTCTFLNYASVNGLKNHFMTRTSRAHFSDFEACPYHVYMPVPLVEKIRPIGNFSSNRMLWANRGSFVDHYAVESYKLLSLMESNQEKHFYKVLFYRDLVDRGITCGHYDLDIRFKALKHRELNEPYMGLTRDKFIDELGVSKFLLTNGHPSVHPQTLEAVCMGCIPIVWNFAEHHFIDIDSNGKCSNVNNLFNIDGTDGICAIIDNEDMYQKYFDSMSRVTKDHENEESYNIFMNELNDRMSKI